jgi:hypothetical protein
VDVVRQVFGAQEYDTDAAGVDAKNGFATVQEGTMGYATKVRRSNEGVPIVSMNNAFATTQGGVPHSLKRLILRASKAISFPVIWLGWMPFCGDDRAT